MKNSYWIGGIVIVVAILGFVFVSRKTEAPLQKNQIIDQTTSLTDGEYLLDLASSTFRWTGEYLNGFSETGIIKFKSGNFKVENGLITHGEFVLDTNSIDSIPHNDLLVKHLKTDDFLSVDQFPTATFVLKKMLPTSEAGAKMGRYVIAGDLTIRGITQPISFVANFKNNNGIFGAKAEFAINRADWQIKYNSPTFFQNLGENIIRDAVSLELDLQSQKVIQ